MKKHNLIEADISELERRRMFDLWGQMHFHFVKKIVIYDLDIKPLVREEIRNGIE